MKRLYSFILLLMSSIAAVATPVGPMNYQGRLLDSAGIPVTGNYDFVVKIYDDPTVGTLKYQENHTDVAVEDGVYSFKVGNGPKTGGSNLWDTDLWQGNLNDLYLEIVVEGETLAPRHELTSAPHAFTSTLALALGNKTAEEFDNILEGVCVASKGKWLELANSGKGACLGAGSSFPQNAGATSVWYNFTADDNFTYLDLTGADISGIEFAGANLTGTRFKQTKYSIASINGANLTDTIWSDSYTDDVTPQNLSTDTNLSGASMKYMSLSKWGFGWLGPYPDKYTGFSAAYLHGECPASIFSAWQCRSQGTPGGSLFLAGPYANLSSTSALAKQTANGYILDTNAVAFDDMTLSDASLTNVTLTQNFFNTYFYNVDLSNSTLRGIRFNGNSNFAGAKFIGARFEDVVFSGPGISLGFNDFSNATMNRVNFSSNLAAPNFTKASLRQVDFGNVTNTNFTKATLEDVRFNGMFQGGAGIIFDETRFYGDLHVSSTIESGAVMNNIEFLGGKVSGALTDLNFTGTITFNNVIFKNLDICSTSFPLVDTSAPHDDLATVRWEGPVECPDGTDVTGGTGANTCNYTGTFRMSQTAVTNCTAGIP